jgi:hypothetical protein
MLLYEISWRFTRKLWGFPDPKRCLNLLKTAIPNWYTSPVLKRYVLPSILIIVLAAVAAGIAYKAKSKLTYNALCTVEVFVRAPATAAASATPDFLTFTNNLAANEVSAATPAVYRELAKSSHLSEGAVASKIQILPAIGIGAFSVSVTDPDPKVTKTLAGSACTTYVNVVKKQRATELSTAIKEIRGRIATAQKEITRLGKIRRRTAAETLELATQQEVLNTNSLLIVNYTSTPPDEVGVLTPAASVIPKRSASLKKYGLIGGVAALLVIFLYILVGEAFMPQQRTASGAPLD